MNSADSILDKSRKETATKLAQKVESTLDSFSIKGIIGAFTFNEDHILLELELAPGIRVEEVESLSKTIAMAVASPTGKVEIIAPLPGTSNVGIKVPTAIKVLH